MGKTLYQKISTEDNLTQFSKGSFDWTKVNNSRQQQKHLPELKSENDFQNKKELKNILKQKINHLMLIEPDTCDIFGPQNSKRIIRRRAQNPNVIFKENTYLGSIIDNSPDLQQTNKNHYSNIINNNQQQILNNNEASPLNIDYNELNYKINNNEINPDQSYQSVMFNGESIEIVKNFSFIKILADKIIEQAAFASIVLKKFQNSQYFIIKASRLKKIDLEIQLAIFVLSVISYSLFSLTILFKSSNVLLLCSSITCCILQMILQYFGIDFADKKTKTLIYCQTAIWNKINKSNLPFFLKKTLILQKALFNMFFIIFLSKNLFNFYGEAKSNTEKHLQNFTLLNIMLLLFELIHRIIPAFVTISLSDKEELEYRQQKDSFEVNSLDSGFMSQFILNSE